MDLNFEMSQVSSKHNLEQLEIKKHNLQTNNLFNKLVAYNYDNKFAQNQQLEDDITKIFDMLIWAEKNCPGLIYQLFQMMAIQQIQTLYINRCLPVFFRNYILVLGNCKQGGLLAELFLDHKLPHIMLIAYVQLSTQSQDKDQMVEYIGSYLKCYHRIFQPQWIDKFVVEQDYFELLEVSFKFFNCPEPLTKTTVFNIVLALLEHSQVQQFIMKNKIRYSFYQNMAEIMTKAIRNQLAEFGLRIQHISIKDSVNEVMSQIQDKIALWEDISRACSTMNQIFQLPFSKNVLLPLLIGALKYEIKPLFTLKFSLFILRKLLKTIKNFDLLQVFIRMIFVEQNVFYWPNTLEKAKVRPFQLQNLLNKHLEIHQEQQKQNYGPGIKVFYQGVLRSKDNHFILMSTILLNHLHQNLKGEQTLIKKYGMHYRGKLYKQISQKLIQQLSQTHRLIAIESILNTLVILNDSKILTQELQTLYIYTFKKTIEEAKNALKTKSQLWDFIVQINQYDLLKINKMQFGKIEDSKMFQQMFKVVFMWDIKQEESSFFAFYSSIPDTVEDNFRYLYAKFLILRKARQNLIQGPEQSNLLAQYYSRIVTNSPYNSGDVHRIYQLNGQFHECQIMEAKLNIPAVWIVDDNFFVLGHWDKDKKQVRIIMGIKYKHICAELVSKKDKVMIKISVKSYDYKTERLKTKNFIIIKGIQNLLHKIIACQIRIREKQMIYISNAIKKTEESLPIPNLI